VSKMWQNVAKMCNVIVITILYCVEV
jgi:hypothetical protein